MAVEFKFAVSAIIPGQQSNSTRKMLLTSSTAQPWSSRTGDAGERFGTAIEIAQHGAAEIVHSMAEELTFAISAIVPGQSPSSTRKVSLTSSTVWPWSSN